MGGCLGLNPPVMTDIGSVKQGSEHSLHAGRHQVSRSHARYIRTHQTLPAGSTGFLHVLSLVPLLQQAAAAGWPMAGERQRRVSSS